MDIDFLVHDTYSMTRPHWTLATDLEEAARIFGEAVAQNYKVQDSERSIDQEDEEAESVLSDDALEDDVEEEQQQQQQPPLQEQQQQQQQQQESSDEEVSYSTSNSFWRMPHLTDTNVRRRLNPSNNH